MTAESNSEIKPKITPELAALIEKIDNEMYTGRGRNLTSLRINT